MKKVLIAALVASTALVAAESSAAPTAEDAIRQVFVQIDRCVANNDAKCIGELMLEDATFSEPMADAKIIKGKTQIIKTLEGLMGDTPNMKGAKQTHTVENIRMVGTDHAFVDSSVQVTGMKPGDGEGANGPRQTFHAFAVMVLKGDKWLFQDLRSYSVGPAWAPPKKEAAPPEKNESAPAAKDSASPTKAPAPPAAH